MKLLFFILFFVIGFLSGRINSIKDDDLRTVVGIVIIILVIFVILIGVNVYPLKIW